MGIEVLNECSGLNDCLVSWGLRGKGGYLLCAMVLLGKFGSLFVFIAWYLLDRRDWICDRLLRGIP